MKLSKADIIASVPQGWSVKVDECGITAYLGSESIDYELDGDRIVRIEYRIDGELHRDPAIGPAFMWQPSPSELYEKYFYEGQPVKSPDGHYGTIKITWDGGQKLITY